MIDGLKKLKTLVIEEENNELGFKLPKLEMTDNTKTKELRKKIAKSNDPKNEYNHKINTNLKEMLEISKILETENENETPKDKTKLKDKKLSNNLTYIRVDKQLNLNSSNEKSSKNSEIRLKIGPQTNLFKYAIKR